METPRFFITTKEGKQVFGKVVDQEKGGIILRLQNGKTIGVPRKLLQPSFRIYHFGKEVGFA